MWVCVRALCVCACVVCVRAVGMCVCPVFDCAPRALQWVCVCAMCVCVCVVCARAVGMCVSSVCDCAPGTAVRCVWLCTLGTAVRGVRAKRPSNANDDDSSLVPDSEWEKKREKQNKMGISHITGLSLLLCLPEPRTSTANSFFLTHQFVYFFFITSGYLPLHLLVLWWNTRA